MEAAIYSPACPADGHPVQPVQDVPRAVGTARLGARARDGASVIDALGMSGCLKLLFPRSAPRLDAVMVNTSGGITTGDRLSLEARAGAGSHLVVTTQAAERAYRAEGAPARVTTALAAADGATLHWLPQELILFDGAALDRRLVCDLAPDSRLLMVEPVIFGRALMGERLNRLRFRDRIEITRAGRPLYRDGLDLSGDAAARLARPAVGQGAGAMAGLVYVGPDAEARLDSVRAHLPTTGGASLLAPDTLVLRVLAEDGFGLRAALLPILDLLSAATLPAAWRL